MKRERERKKTRLFISVGGLLKDGIGIKNRTKQNKTVTWIIMRLIRSPSDGAPISINFMNQHFQSRSVIFCNALAACCLT